MNTPRLRTALLGSGAAIALLVATGPVAADEIDDLRAQINALQDKVTQIQADETAKPRVAPAAAVSMFVAPGPMELVQAMVRNRLLALANPAAVCTMPCSLRHW